MNNEIRCGFWSREQGQQCCGPAKGLRDGVPACSVHINPLTKKLKPAAQVLSDYFTKGIAPFKQLNA